MNSFLQKIEWVIKQISFSRKEGGCKSKHYQQEKGRWCPGQSLPENDSKCAFSQSEIQRLRRLMREGIPERISRS